MRKKLGFAAVLITMLCLVVCLSMSVCAAEEYVDGLYTYTVADGEATIVGVDNSISGDVAVPNALGGYKVVAIGANAFKNRTAITNITIPETVSIIGKYAFENTGIKEATIHKNITEIGSRAFAECESLNTVNYYPESIDSVGSLGYAVFAGCPLLSEVNIGANVKKIPDYLFAKCSALTEVIIPETVSIIGEYAFAETGISKITIHKNITEIGIGAFAECESLNTVNYYPESIDSVGWSGGYAVFAGCPLLSEVNIGANVKKIPGNLFGSCTSIKNVEIPPSVAEIGEGAFRGCTSITEITIPETVSIIGGYAFENTGIKEATIHKSITAIGAGAFSNCKALTTVNYYPEKIDSVGISNFTVFAGCPLLSKVNIGANVKKIPDYLFAKCSALTEVIIPETVSIIGENAFAETGIIKITIHENITEIGAAAFYKCQNLSEVEYKPEKIDVVGTVNFPPFHRCPLLSEVQIGQNVKKIPDYLFNYCSGIKRVEIPSSVTEIGSYAFHDCTSLEQIIIPENVNKIGNRAFSGCSNLKDFILLNGLCVLHDNANTISDTAVVYGYDNSTAELYAEKYDRQFVSLGEKLYYDFSDGVLVITGKGVILSNDNPEAFPWNVYSGLTHELVLNGVTLVGKNAFAGFTKLRTVIIDGETVSIESGAFADCPDLSLVVSYADVNFAEDAISGNTKQVKYFTDSSKTSNIPSVSFSFDGIGAVVSGEVNFTRDEFLSFVATLYYGFDEDFYTIRFNKLVADDFYIYKYTSLEPFEAITVTEVENADVSVIIELDENAYMQFSMRDFCEGMVDSGEDAEINYKIAVVSDEEKGFFEMISEVFATWLEAIKKVISAVFKIFRK